MLFRSKGGSYAAAKEHMEVRADLVDQDKHMVATAMNQLFRWVGELNAPDAAPPLFGFYEEDDVQKDRAERDEILTRQGVRFKQAYYEKAYALDPDDFDVQAPGRPVLGAAGADPAHLHLREEEQNPAFAETQSATRFQGEVELLADESARAAQAGLDRLIEPVMALVEKAVSLEEIGEGLYELYPQMESQRFQELLARAMSAAAMTGYVAASEERS